MFEILIPILKIFAPIITFSVAFSMGVIYGVDQTVAMIIAGACAFGSIVIVIKLPF